MYLYIKLYLNFQRIQNLRELNAICTLEFLRGSSVRLKKKQFYNNSKKEMLRATTLIAARKMLNLV